MSVARPGATRVGAAVTVRSLALLLAAGLSCLAVAFPGAPARAEAAGSGGPVCVGPTLARPPRDRGRPRLAVGFVGVAGWLGARAATALAEKGFVTGFEAVLRAAGHQNAGEQTLAAAGRDQRASGRGLGPARPRRGST